MQTEGNKQNPNVWNLNLIKIWNVDCTDLVTHGIYEGKGVKQMKNTIIIDHLCEDGGGNE